MFTLLYPSKLCEKSLKIICSNYCNFSVLNKIFFKFLSVFFNRKNFPLEPKGLSVRQWWSWYTYVYVRILLTGRGVRLMWMQQLKIIYRKIEIMLLWYKCVLLTLTGNFTLISSVTGLVSCAVLLRDREQAKREILSCETCFIINCDGCF